MHASIDTYIHTYIQIDAQMGGWVGGWVGGWIDESLSVSIIFAYARVSVGLHYWDEYTHTHLTRAHLPCRAWWLGDPGAAT